MSDPHGQGQNQSRDGRIRPSAFDLTLILIFTGKGRGFSRATNAYPMGLMQKDKSRVVGITTGVR